MTNLAETSADLQYLPYFSLRIMPWFLARHVATWYRDYIFHLSLQLREQEMHDWPVGNKQKSCVQFIRNLPYTWGMRILLPLLCWLECKSNDWHFSLNLWSEVVLRSENILLEHQDKMCLDSLCDQGLPALHLLNYKLPGEKEIHSYLIWGTAILDVFICI